MRSLCHGRFGKQLRQILPLHFFSFCLVTLLSGQMAFAQQLVLDLTQIGGSIGATGVFQDTEEFFYSVIGPTPQQLFAASYSNPGMQRTLPTQGIDVARFSLETFQGRGLVNDFTNSGVFAVDYSGTGAPIPLSVEPSEDFLPHFPSGLVALPVQGDSLAADPADRDQLYTRSIIGGPATEITGGLPSFRELGSVNFSADGNTLILGTRTTGNFGQGIFTNSDLFLATPGVTGLTPILDNLGGGTRFFPGNSDAANEHFFVEALNINASAGPRPWSVPIANPTAAFQLALRDNNTQISFSNGTFDPLASRVLYSSRELEDNPFGEPSIYTVWTEALDGSTGPTVLTKLPADREPFEFRPIENSPWIYVGAEEPLTVGIENASYIAVNSSTGEVIEFTDAGGLGLNTQSLEITADGSAILFTSEDTAGNDLYIGRPDAIGTKQEVLWDVPDTERLLRFQLSEDEQFVVATVVDAATTDTNFADRLVAIPVDGGAPIELDNGALAEVPFVIGSAIFGPTLVDGRVIYLRANATEAGFFVIDLPLLADLTADFDGDGDVDLDDLTDPTLGFNARFGVDLDGTNFLEWQQQFTGSAALSALQSVPEPAGFVSLLVCLSTLLTTTRNRKCRRVFT